MQVLFLIATYQRPNRLLNLLEQVYNTCPLSAKVIVVNDCSNKDYSKPQKLLRQQNGSFVSLDTHCGKREYWRVVDRLFQEAKEQEFRYVFKLDDDITLYPKAISNSLLILEKLVDRNKKVVLNMLVDHRADKPVWTGILPQTTSIDSMKLRKVGWVDGGNWAASQAVMKALDWSCPEPPESWWSRPGDSSGVGKYLSVALSRTACRIYMPFESFVYHGDHPSVMFPNKTNRPVQMKNEPWL